MPKAIWSDFEKRFDLPDSRVLRRRRRRAHRQADRRRPIGSIGKPIATLKHRIVDAEGRDVARG